MLAVGSVGVRRFLGWRLSSADVSRGLSDLSQNSGAVRAFGGSLSAGLVLVWRRCWFGNGIVLRFGVTSWCSCRCRGNGIEFRSIGSTWAQVAG